MVNTFSVDTFSHLEALCSDVTVTVTSFRGDLVRGTSNRLETSATGQQVVYNQSVNTHRSVHDQEMKIDRGSWNLLIGNLTKKLRTYSDWIASVKADRLVELRRRETNPSYRTQIISTIPIRIEFSR